MMKGYKNIFKPNEKNKKHLDFGKERIRKDSNIEKKPNFFGRVLYEIKSYFSRKELKTVEEVIEQTEGLETEIQTASTESNLTDLYRLAHKSTRRTKNTKNRLPEIQKEVSARADIVGKEIEKGKREPGISGGLYAAVNSIMGTEKT